MRKSVGERDGGLYSFACAKNSPTICIFGAANFTQAL